MGSSAIALVSFVGGLVGTVLAPSPVWATLPVTASIAGNALCTLPAALLMKRIGRRPGFLLAALVAGLAAVVAALAIQTRLFGLFCVATALIGGSGAFVLQYRFAAAESVEPSRLGTAVAVVLGGGVAAGVLGPQLGELGRDLVGSAEFSGSFLLLVGVEVVALALLWFYRAPPRPSAGIGAPPGPPPRRGALGSILAKPRTVVAIVAACCASGVMTFNMTAAPLGMHVMAHHSLRATGFVIQSHIVAMYVPSFFTGFLIARMSLFAVMMSGCGLLLLSAAVAMTGMGIGVYWTALVLLGLGWNLLFVGGTTLLARSYDSESRFAIQGLNDFLVVGVQAIASLLSSGVLFAAGWHALNAITIPLVLAVAVTLLVLKRLPGALADAPPTPVTRAARVSST